jgi:ABC-type polar amino acid transport system ATPase subunit
MKDQSDATIGRNDNLALSEINPGRATTWRGPSRRFAPSGLHNLFPHRTALANIMMAPETMKDVLVTIRQLAEEGMTCVIVTHEMGFAREVADHVYFIDGGVVVEHGPPGEFFGHCRDERTRRF